MGSADRGVQQELSLQDPCTVPAFWWPAPSGEEIGEEPAATQGSAETQGQMLWGPLLSGSIAWVTVSCNGIHLTLQLYVGRKPLISAFTCSAVFLIENFTMLIHRLMLSAIWN